MSDVYGDEYTDTYGEAASGDATAPVDLIEGSVSISSPLGLGDATTSLPGPPPPVTSYAIHSLAADWSGHGHFEGTLENLSTGGRVRKDHTIEIAIGREGAQTILPAVAGRMSFVLNNQDRALSPENESSPIYGRIEPGRGIRYQVPHGDRIYTLFDGVLDDFSVDNTDAAFPFSGEALDAWGRPGAERLSTELYRGIRTGDAINIILDAIGWAGERRIDPGVTVMPYWWAEGVDAAEAVAQLIYSEGPPSVAFVEGGTFVFEDRHHRIFTEESTTSQATFTHIIPAGPIGTDAKIKKGSFVYNHGLKNIVNAVEFSVPIRTIGEPTDVWSADEPIEMVSGETIQIQAEASEPFIDAAVSRTLEYGVIGTSMSRRSGQAVTITIVASANSRITRLALVANPITVTRTVRVDAEDASSIGVHGRYTWPNEVPWASRYDAQAIANRIVATYATNRPTVVFAIQAHPSMTTHRDQILLRRISDRITVRNDMIGLNSDFIIERIVHRIDQLGLIHEAEFWCQVVDPEQPSNIFTFNVAGRGFNDGAFGTTGIDAASAVFRFDVAGQGFDQGVFGS